ncbi:MULTISPECIES: superoxide dismutase family protein [Kitasatospora]|uniref:Cu-Zn family superoxide dismutase n=2 Tax=Kitasatospora TaxID=2063 RepID=A0ABT1IYV4_9ACTN|nr:superoxide dismutase family protein [Kitasatospora paracochleata]MCP2310342.1 Cu-Zn family superoxide dismutase [Kitasatospora paracochleata]
MPLPPAASLLPLVLVPVLSPPMVVDARFDRADGFAPAAAVSHVTDLVPYGSHVRVTVTRGPGRTTVALAVEGLAPRHEFPAHVHTGRCGLDPAASGPHYQDRVDAAQPSADSAYADGDNELRLTLRTNADGAGRTQTTVPWTFRPDEAHSLVLHAGRQSGGHQPTRAYQSTDRAACVNVDF